MLNILLKNNLKRLIILNAGILFFLTNVNAQSDTIQTNVPALKDVYANDFYIGCLLSYRYIGFPDDPYVPGQSPVITPNGGYLIKFHMNSMSPGNNMKSQYTVDISASAAAYVSASAEDKDSVNTHPIVRFNGDMIAQLNWAERQGFTFRGHTLVWHNQTPGTAFFRTGYSATGSYLTKEKMIERMDNYIKEIIRLLHEGWPGLLSAMDVVNEAVNDNGTDRSINNEWYTVFGDSSYIMEAFASARKHTIAYGETQIKLYYNDYNTHLSAKADGIVRICQPIFEAGYLDGIGMQDHDQYNTPSAANWIASYDKFYPICNEMAVTELDVKPSSTTLTIPVLTTQANQYAQLFKCFIERSYFSGGGKIISVSKDGLNDQYAFVANASLWDANNQCKPAFYAVVDLCFNYYSLDSLISVADSLDENEYTIDSWNNLTVALTFAKDALNKNYSYYDSAVDALKNAGDSLNAAIESLEKIETGIDDINNNIPVNFSLSQNYPNPFNPSTTISFAVPYNSDVRITLYNILGKAVEEIVNRNYDAGYHSIKFNATGLASGIYFYKIEAIPVQLSDRLVINFVSVKKLMLMK